MTAPRQRFLIAAMGLAMLAHSTPSSSEAQTYEAAEFTASADPAAVVLVVRTHAVMEDLTSSMRLFGDGRLELTVSGHSPKRERRIVHLTESATRELIDIATHHGLAEWDTIRIETEQEILLNGRQFAVADGNVVSVTLSLESYRRGDLVRSNIVKKISVASPDIAMDRFPSMPEFRGLFELQKYLWRMLKTEGLK